MFCRDARLTRQIHALIRLRFQPYLSVIPATLQDLRRSPSFTKSSTVHGHSQKSFKNIKPNWTFSFLKLPISGGNGSSSEDDDSPYLPERDYLEAYQKLKSAINYTVRFGFCFEKETMLDKKEKKRGRRRERGLWNARQKSLIHFAGVTWLVINLFW